MDIIWVVGIVMLLVSGLIRFSIVLLVIMCCVVEVLVVGLVWLL